MKSLASVRVVHDGEETVAQNQGRAATKQQAALPKQAASPLPPPVDASNEEDVVEAPCLQPLSHRVAATSAESTHIYQA